MSHDFAIAMPLIIVLVISWTDIYGLIKDRDAKGVRPYLPAWLTLSNIFVAYQFFSAGMPITGSVFLMSTAQTGLKAALIIKYQYGSLSPRRIVNPVAMK